MLLISILFYFLALIKDHTLAIQCFSCASEEYEALYKKGAFNFNYKPQNFFQPRFDYACDNSYETTNFVPVKDCLTNCVVVLEKQFFGGILNENRPYLYIRGCTADVFQAGDIHSPEVQFLQKSKICLPLMVSQIWPHVESNEYITACSCDEDGCNNFVNELNISSKCTINIPLFLFLQIILLITLYGIQL
uniref:Ly-6-related protein HOT-5 (inferred by orthology to a C. elegans protein) n=1 Tax=Strongyloides venezuelensis TaxID=75913 RepID=A0A0K0F5P0_STRVS